MREVITTGRFVPDDPHAFAKTYRPTVWHAGESHYGRLEKENMTGQMHIEEGYIRLAETIIPTTLEGIDMTYLTQERAYPGLYLPYPRAIHSFYEDGV